MRTARAAAGQQSGAHHKRVCLAGMRWGVLRGVARRGEEVQVQLPQGVDAQAVCCYVEGRRA